MQDMVDRNRSSRGEKHGRVKLTKEQIDAIRIDPRPQKLIAADYGIKQPQVSRIKNRLRWKE